MLCGAGGVLAAEPQLVAQTAAPVAGLVWTDDGAAFAVGGADGVSIRDAVAGSVRATLPGARALAFAKEAGSGGKLFVTLSDGGELSLWNFQAGKALPADISFAVDPAGSGTGTVAGTGQSADGGLSATGTAAPAGDTLRYTACAFSRNSDYIAAGTEDGSLRIFFKLRFARQFLMKEAGGQTGKITALTFSPDSRLLASASEDGTALLMSLPSAAVVARLPFYAPRLCSRRNACGSPGRTERRLLRVGRHAVRQPDRGRRHRSRQLLDGQRNACGSDDGRNAFPVCRCDGGLHCFHTARLRFAAELLCVQR